MRSIFTIALTAATLLLTGSTLFAQRGRQGGPPNLPEQASPQARQIHNVPEPATLTLLALGLGVGIAAVRRRARTRSTGN